MGDIIENCFADSIEIGRFIKTCDKPSELASFRQQQRRRRLSKTPQEKQLGLCPLLINYDWMHFGDFLSLLSKKLMLDSSNSCGKAKKRKGNCENERNRKILKKAVSRKSTNSFSSLESSKKKKNVPRRKRSKRLRTYRSFVKMEE